MLTKKFQNYHSDSQLFRLILFVLKVLIFLTLLLCALWAGLVLWVHLKDYPILRWTSMAVVVGIPISLIVYYKKRSSAFCKIFLGSAVAWALLLAWFVWLPPKDDRSWQAEVSKKISYYQHQENPDIITLNNVRDFGWQRSEHSHILVQPKKPYYYKVANKTTVEGERIDEVTYERWIERTIDMSKLSGVDIINAYWMGEQIGHTLLSFRFENDRPLTFSIEIRKEEDESFSALGGFVKQFEMILVGAEERDMVYTRSNVRGEQVYIFPVQGITHKQTRELFKEYLNLADTLNKKPKWYNTLIRNCTTVLFEMAHDATNGRFPRDYRILLSGYVPDYLYDEGLIPKNEWDISEWYQQAHINPKVADFSLIDNQRSYEYSKIIRQGIPTPTLNEH